MRYYDISTALNPETITASLLEESDIPPIERILFKTGSSRLYKEKEFNVDFSALDETEAAPVRAILMDINQH